MKEEYRTDLCRIDKVVQFCITELRKKQKEQFNINKKLKSLNNKQQL